MLDGHEGGVADFPLLLLTEALEHTHHPPHHTLTHPPHAHPQTLGTRRSHWSNHLNGFRKDSGAFATSPNMHILQSIKGGRCRRDFKEHMFAKLLAPAARASCKLVCLVKVATSLYIQCDNASLDPTHFPTCSSTWRQWRINTSTIIKLFQPKWFPRVEHT